MSEHFIDKFDEFTVGHNDGFKLNINGVIVSVVCHNSFDAIEEMVNTRNGMVGQHLADEIEKNKRSIFDFSTLNDVPFFTFHAADVCIFGADISERDDKFSTLTHKFVDTSSINYDGESGIVTISSALELLDICNKVREYTEKKGDN